MFNDCFAYFSERKKRKVRSSSASIKDPLVIDTVEPLPALLDSACDALETPTAVSEIIQETEVEVRPAKRAYHRKVPSAASIAAAVSLSEVPAVETPLIPEAEPLLGNFRVDIYYIGTISVTRLYFLVLLSFTIQSNIRLQPGLADVVRVPLPKQIPRQAHHVRLQLPNDVVESLALKTGLVRLVIRWRHLLTLL